MSRPTYFVARFVARCGAPLDGCATTGRRLPEFVAHPTVLRRFVARFVAQHLWRRPTAHRPHRRGNRRSLQANAMTYHQTISLLAQQLQDANATISRQAETIAQQQRALCQLSHELRVLRVSVPSADPPPFPMRALRHGSPA